MSCNPVKNVLGLPLIGRVLLISAISLAFAASFALASDQTEDEKDCDGFIECNSIEYDKYGNPKGNAKFDKYGDPLQKKKKYDKYGNVEKGDIGAIRSCAFTSDCGVGQQCLKDSRSVFGICVGGGSSQPKTAAGSSLLGGQGKLGRSCYFDSGCGLGFKCAKDSTGATGFCVKR